MTECWRKEQEWYVNQLEISEALEHQTLSLLFWKALRGLCQGWGVFPSDNCRKATLSEETGRIQHKMSSYSSVRMPFTLIQYIKKHTNMYDYYLKRASQVLQVAWAIRASWEVAGVPDSAGGQRA